MKKLFKFILIVFVALITVVLLWPDKTKSNSNSSTKQNQTATATDDTISLNDVALVDDFECRIKEINWYKASDFDYDFVDKESGFEYIVLVLSAKNTTNSTKNAPSYFILSADGKDCNTVTALSLYKKKYKINFGATMAKTTAEAYTVFKVPYGSQSFKFQIISNGFGKPSKYMVFDKNDIR